VTVTARALPTAFDPPTGVVTVATPSCCCCCCCCLNAIGAGIGASTAAARAAARSHGRSQVAPTLLASGGAVLASGLAWLVAAGLEVDAPTGPIAVGLLTFSAGTTAALYTAGVKLRTAVAVAIAIATVTGVLGVLEVFVALFTALIIEFATPLSIWGGSVLGRSMMSDDAGVPPTDTPADVLQADTPPDARDEEQA